MKRDNRSARTEREAWRRITVCGEEYLLLSELGRGASCITYCAERGAEKVVVKEFYPIGGCASRVVDGSVKAEKGREVEFERRRKEFRAAADFHYGSIRAIQANQFMELRTIDGDFLISDYRDGMTLAQWIVNQRNRRNEPDYLRECVSIFRCVLEEVEKYHNAGYVHLDLKAENLYRFNIEGGQQLVRIFDFDSIQRADALFDRIHEGTARVHTSFDCYGPEAMSFQQRASEWLERPEQLYLLDYYALGNVLHRMLTGETYSAGQVEEFVVSAAEDYPVLNQYLRRLFSGGGPFFSPVKRRAKNGSLLWQYAEHIRFLLDHAEFYRDPAVRNAQDSRLKWMAPIELDEAVFLPDRTAPLEQLMRKIPGHLQLTGTGGSGKTTALLWVAYRSAVNFRTVGFRCWYLRLNRELWEPEDVDHLAEEILCSRGGETAACWLLDAFDEIGDPEVKAYLKETLEGILAENAEDETLRVVITSRTPVWNHTEPAGTFFRMAVMQPLTPGIVLQGVKKYGDPNRTLSRKELELLRTPMMLSMYTELERMSYVDSRVRKKLLGFRAGQPLAMETEAELIWNYLYCITLANCQNIEAMKARKRLLEKILPNYPAAGFLDEDDRELLEVCESLGYYMLHRNWDGRMMVEFSHRLFQQFFDAVGRVRMYEDSIKKGKDDWLDSNPVFSSEEFVYKYPESDDLSDETLQEAFPLLRDLLNARIRDGKLNPDFPVQLLERVRKNKSASCQVLPEILWLLHREEDGEVLFSDLDLSGLALGNLAFLWHIADKWGECLFLEGTEVTEQVRIRFRNVCFDEALLIVKGNYNAAFENCTFRNLNKESFVHPRFQLSEQIFWQIGEDFYTVDGTVLMDCSPEASGSFQLLPQTARIDLEFKRHCSGERQPVLLQGHSFFQWENGVLIQLEGELFSGAEVAMCRGDLQKIVLENGRWKGLPLSEGALFNCSSLQTVILVGTPGSVPPEGLFFGCSRLNTIEVREMESFDLQILKGASAKNLCLKDAEVPGRCYRDMNNVWHELPPCVMPVYAPYVEPRMRVFVPDEYLELYRLESGWGEFFIYGTSRLAQAACLPLDSKDPWECDDYYDIWEEDGSDPDAFPF